MAQRGRALATPAEDLSLGPSNHMKQLTVVCDSRARRSHTSDCCGHLHACLRAHTQSHSPANNQKEQKYFKKRSREYSCIPGNSSMRVLLNKTTAHVLIDLFSSALEIIHKALQDHL